MKLVQRPVRLPWSIVALSFALVTIGWLGIARAETLADGSGRLLAQQIVWTPIAIAGMLAVTRINHRLVCQLSYVLFAFSLLLLIAVYFFPTVRGAHRWIRLGPIGVQPSELAKIAFVLALARWLTYRENYRRLVGLFVPLLLTLVPLLLILREPDLGTALVFLPVLFVMLFAAGARGRDLATLAVAGLFVTPLLWSQMSREQKSRVTAVLSQTAPEETPDADRYHLHRAKQTLAAGGVWGTWLRGDPATEASNYLVPAAATDSILCILGERFGLWGIAALLLLFLLLLARCLAVARNTQEPFGRLVVVGLVSLLGVGLLINAAIMVGLLPITGMSLPLVSYGGSGLLANALGLGLVLSVGLRPGYEVAGEPFRFIEHRRAA